jgi:hypothetical protein
MPLSIVSNSISNSMLKDNSTLSIKASTAFESAVWISSITVTGYFIWGRFYGTCAFFLFFPTLIIALIYIVNILSNCIFAIIQRKKYDRSSIPLRLNIIALVFMYCLPTVNHSKAYPLGSHPLSSSAKREIGGLYLEYYTVYGGGFMTTDDVAVYLTDYSNFRVYLGIYDESDKPIGVKCDGDQITTIKENPNYASAIKTERLLYSLKKLKENHSFD